MRGDTPPMHKRSHAKRAYPVQSEGMHTRGKPQPTNSLTRHCEDVVQSEALNDDVAILVC